MEKQKKAEQDRKSTQIKCTVNGFEFEAEGELYEVLRKLQEFFTSLGVKDQTTPEKTKSKR